MFGKRSTPGANASTPPPAPAGGSAIPTRPQKQDAPRPDAAAVEPQALAKAAASQGPRQTSGLDQLRAAQAGRPSGAITEVVRDQSD